MTAPRRALLLINHQGTRGSSRLEGGLALLRQAGAEVTVVMPDHPKRIPELIRQQARDHDAVIIGGGDGTLSRALDALLKCGLPLGILPLGNANDLARTLQIPPNLEAAFRIIAEGNARPIDVGQIDRANAPPTHFFNVASIGLSVRIAKRLTPDRKQRWGIVAYIACAWESMHRQRSFRATITCDGQVSEVQAMQVAVGNGRFYGGGMTIVDDAAIDDHRLDLYALPRLSGWRMLVLLPVLRWGWHRPVGDILSLRGKEIAVETDRALAVNVDGEVRARSPVRFRVLPGAIRVYVPVSGNAETADADTANADTADADTAAADRAAP